MKNLTDPEKLVLVKLVPDKLAKVIRPKVPAGTYNGRMVLSIEYGMTVNPDHEQKVAASIPWQRVATIALSKLNATTGEAIESIVRDAMGKGELVDESSVKTAAKAVVERLLAGAKKTVSGSVSVSATVKAVDAPALIDREVWSAFNKQEKTA